jgi:hypothetical protein
MKSIFFSIILFFLCSGYIFSQLKVASNGNVGIGTINPLSLLSINSDGNNTITLQCNNTTTSGGASIRCLSTGSNSGRKYGVIGETTLGGDLSFGLYGKAYSSTVLSFGRAFGVMGISGNATSGYNYSVYGILDGSNNGTAIIGSVGYQSDCIPGRYAGYFLGNVYMSTSLSIGFTSSSYALDVNGTIRGTTVTQTSDGRLKDNIKNMSGAMSSIGKLQGVTYKLKPNGLKGLKTKTLAANSISDTSKITTMVAEKIETDSSLYKRSHIGFVAQDLQKVFPELVYEDKDGILSVDYISLIPVLVEGMKEQKGLVDKLLKDIETLKLENEKLKKKVGLY